LPSPQLQAKQSPKEKKEERKGVKEKERERVRKEVMEIAQSVKDSVAATKVDYVQLGKSGLRVSVPILGAMSIGYQDWAPWVIDEEKASSRPIRPSSRLTLPLPNGPKKPLICSPYSSQIHSIR
jgi:hypothetical protein